MKKNLRNPLSVLGICFLILIAVIVVANVMYKPPPAVQINENALTAKQLSVLCDEYVREYGVNQDLYLSNIVMLIDNNHKGEVTMTYTYEKKGRYYRYFVEVSTDEHIIKSIYEIDKSVVAGIDFMDFAEWNIDSDEAVRIALNALRDRGYEIDDSKIRIDVVRSNSGDSWDIAFYANNNKKLYGRSPTVLVDAQTGEASSYFW